jgi:DNA oxidative demethylase
MDLFENIQPNKLEVDKDAYYLSGYALTNEKALIIDLHEVLSQASLRQMMTKMGFYTSAAMTNCGQLGWVSDRKGYRYEALNPLTGKSWPAMPVSFFQLAQNAALEAGFSDFKPDACLINQYKVGASMGLHQDKNELDFTQPILSVSLGIPAIFKFGGLSRSDKPIKIRLTHGDIVVWGGDARLNYHGIIPLQPNNHAVLGPYRYNLTFRKAG